MCMVEIRNRETLQSKVNICKSDVKIGEYADSLTFPFQCLNTETRSLLTILKRNTPVFPLEGGTHLCLLKRRHIGFLFLSLHRSTQGYLG